MIRNRGIFIAAMFALFATGCFEIEQSVELKKDLSGTAHLTLGVGHVPFYDDPAVVAATIRSGASV